ncbi:tRNA (guanine(37)-N(1))-methyltransferase isoform X2 [Bemisia tabaci]|uniref:tRNA (guanine(37)-N(1))-methyltransferase isoform X2 n=1 Tax=Bemisia tabaci TaxID=7038 RepID=UPI003B285DBF
MAVLRYLKHIRFQFMIHKTFCMVVELSKMEDILMPPTAARGMKVLDKELLKKTITVPCLDIEEKVVNPSLKLIRNYTLKLPNFKPVVPVNSSETSSDKIADKISERRVFLNPKIISSFNDFDPSIQQKLAEFNVKPRNLKSCSITLTYDNWKPDDLFRTIIPPEVGSFSSYSIIGQIIHINLKDHLVDYKHVIGQILFDKIPTCKTVVNKIGSINNEYRTFNMEVLCGSPDLATTVKENNCTFEFNFRDVYWNPRLGAEHARIVSRMKRNDILFDVFAGVGPFVIPAAKICHKVYANDLNPACHEALQRNIFLNNVGSKVETFNKDAKFFITEDFKRIALQLSQNPEVRDAQIHIIMNLPESAVTFLKYFVGLFSPAELNLLHSFTELFLVHVYCFIKATEENKLELAEAVVKTSLGNPSSLLIQESAIVRNVSNNKEMIRVSFFLTENLLRNRYFENLGPPPSKKFCHDER